MNSEIDQSLTLNRDIRILVALLAIISIILSGYVLIELKTIIVPLVIALIISFILKPVITFFEKWHIPEWLSIVFVIFLTFVVFYFIGQVINSSIREFMSNIQQYEARFKTILDGIVALLNITGIQVTEGTSISDHPRLSEFIQSLSIAEVITKILGSISAIISNTFLVLLYLLFLLIGRDKMIHKLDIAFKSEVSGQMKNIVKSVTDQINKYIVTKTLISMFTGSLVYITLLLFGVEFAFIWGLIAFLLNYIPNIGSALATIFPVVFAIIQFDNFIMVIWIAVILFAIQFLVGNVIEPKVVGSSVNISPVVVLFSLIFWGYVWGVIGMILAVPFAVIIKIILENISALKPLSVLMSDYKLAKNPKKS
jgi:predicted PurR-regulated permease PerM